MRTSALFFALALSSIAAACKRSTGTERSKASAPIPPAAGTATAITSSKAGGAGTQADRAAAGGGGAGSEDSLRADPGDRTQDIAGLKLIQRKDGSLSLSGSDRWGKPLDTTYESGAFFKKAVPVLAGSVTPEQAEGLRKAADAMGPAAP